MLVLGNLVLCLCEFMLHKAVRPQYDFGPQIRDLFVDDFRALIPQPDHYHHALVILFPVCRRPLCPLKLSHNCLLVFIAGLSYPEDFVCLMESQSLRSVGLVLL